MAYRQFIHHKNKWNLEGVCSEAAQFFSRLADEMPSGWTTAYNNFILGFVNAGIWYKHDAIWITAGNTDNNSRINLITASNTLNLINGPTHTAKEGYTGDGISKYLETNFTPSVHSTNYSVNSASIWVRESNFIVDNTILQTAIGANDSGAGSVILRSTNTRPYGNVTRWNLNSRRSSEYGNTSIKSIRRLNGTSSQFFEDGVQRHTLTDTPYGSLSAEMFYLLADNNGGTARYFSKNTINMIGIASGLTNDEIAAKDTLIEDFFTEIAAL